MNAYVLLNDYGYEGYGLPEAVWVGQFPTREQLREVLVKIMMPEECHSGYDLATLQEQTATLIDEAIPYILAGNRLPSCPYIIVETDFYGVLHDD